MPTTPCDHKPRILFVGALRVPGGITVITRRFVGDPEVQRRYHVKVQDQGYLGKWNQIDFLRPVKLPVGVVVTLWNMLTFRPAIVHIQTSYKGGFLRDGLIALLAKWLGAKVILTFQSGGRKGLPQIYRQGPNWLKWFSCQVIPQMDALVACGPSYARFLRDQFGHRNVHIAPNPVADEQVPDPVDYASRERIVFFAGFIGKRKGVFELLKAAEKVPDAKFIICGEAQFPRDLATFKSALSNCTARSRIHWNGHCDISQVFEHMNQARLLALPSWGETMPLVLEEAIVCGLPVVTTPVGVIADYVQDGIHGYLIEPGDVDALAEAINRILDDEEWALEISERNRVFGQQFLSSVAHQRIFEMYDELLPQPT